MQSLLARLAADVESAKNPQELSSALADLGIALAQLGRIPEAVDISNRLKSLLESNESNKGSIRCLILEGVIEYYKNRSIKSLDRIRRAHVLSRAFGLKHQVAESAVWLAHLTFNFDDYDALRSAVQTSLEEFELLNESLRARTCLVVADINQYLGYRAESLEWYRLARSFSQRVRDHAVMAAIEYNRLVIGQSRSRIDRILLVPTQSTIDRDWRTEHQSVRSLHSGFGANALIELLLVSEAQWHEMHGDFPSAWQALRKIQESGAAEGCGTTDALLALEMQWCRVMGDMDGVVDAELINNLPTLSDIGSMEMNEQLLTLSFLKDICVRRKLSIDTVNIEIALERAKKYCVENLTQIEKAVAPALEYLDRVRSIAAVVADSH